MHIHDILAASPGPGISFEFFPPRSPGAKEALRDTLRELERWRPAFVSVTYGAGGGTRDLTRGLVEDLGKGGLFDPIPHLTCVGHREAEIEALLTRYAEAGVGNVLALRGDLPKAGLREGDFAQAADLVRFIRRFNARGLHPDPRGFGIGAACFPEGHPSTSNRLREMDHLKAKVDAGVDYLCTQVFFDNRDFHDFRDRCELAGIHVPIIAGILPLTTVEGMRRMADLAGGTRYPAKLLRALDRTGGDATAFRRVALHHAVEQCHDLLDHGVAGLHFYTLNQAEPVNQLLQNLGRQACEGKPTEPDALRELALTPA